MFEVIYDHTDHDGTVYQGMLWGIYIEREAALNVIKQLETCEFASNIELVESVDDQ